MNKVSMITERKIDGFDASGNRAEWELNALKQNNFTDIELIDEFNEEKVSKLIIVTGKGIHSDNEKNPYVSKDLGILKFSIPEFIKNNSELKSIILDIKDANIEDGGSGAFYIYLKKK